MWIELFCVLSCILFKVYISNIPRQMIIMRHNFHNNQHEKGNLDLLTHLAKEVEQRYEGLEVFHWVCDNKLLHAVI